jgi:hypothetical protein
MPRDDEATGNPSQLSPSLAIIPAKNDSASSSSELRPSLYESCV